MVQTGLQFAKTESWIELQHAEFDNLSFYETNYAHIGLVEGKNSQPSKKRNKSQDLRRYPGFFSITFNFSENSNYCRESLFEVIRQNNDGGCQQTPSNVLPLDLKQTFPLIIWIFTEGDGIESRLPFKIFSTLQIEISLC